MTTCLARQPIFDAKLNVYGYELLYRSGENSLFYDGTDPDQASSEAIMLSLDIGSRKLTGNRMAFINFTEKLLLNEVATILPRNHLIVEILENVRPREDVISVCEKLKAQNYQLSLDDFKYSDSYKPFLDLADIVKIDFLQFNDYDMINSEVRKINSALRKNSRQQKVRLLAEKVETREAFIAAKEMGFTYFQGFFFSRPEIVSKKLMNPLRVNQLKLIRNTMDPMVDYKKLATTISNDPVLSYRILRLVNSAYYALEYKVKSISHALAILGIKNIRKYVTLLAIEQIKDEKPEELFRMSLIRAHFLESLAPLAGMRKSKDDLFMLGLFSLMDIMTDTPMNDIVELTQLSESISDPLVTNKGKSADLLSIIKNYEQGSWIKASVIAGKYGISSHEILKLYLDSLEWADDMFD